MPTLSNTPPHRRRNRRARVQPRRTPHADPEGHSARQRGCALRLRHLRQRSRTDRRAVLLDCSKQVDKQPTRQHPDKQQTPPPRD